jgi:RNA polymerase sigma-70 factor (ECF subfamily)
MIAHAGNQVTETYSVAETFQKYDQLVETALSQLSPQRRRVFTMIRLEGKSYNEVANALGISVNTIKDHLQMANQTLKRFIRETGEFVIAIILLENLF